MARSTTSRHPSVLWLRWSWRDLRARWVQVTAIALVIALGTGMYLGLSSSAAWRQVSYDASYAESNAHDLLVETATGTTADRLALETALDQVAHPEWFADRSVRLVVPVQVDASTDDEDVLVPGQIVGVDVVQGPTVDRVTVTEGRPLTAADDGRLVGLAELRFANARNLPVEHEVRISGDRSLQLQGHAQSPEYFPTASEEAGIFGSAGFAVLFAPLGTAQALNAQEGQVNEVGVALADGVDAEAARAEVEQALSAALPDVALTVTPLVEERGYRILYDDIDGDQRLFNIFAGLILAGAAFAAFNLTGRIVEAQRREIGIGMSLGVPSPLLAVRPLLVAFQVALIGVAAGIGVGLVVGSVMSTIIQSFFPMPAWQTPFQVGIFARGIALGIVLVVVASLFPVVRAVRVPPIEAIHTGPRATRGAGLAVRGRGLHLPGNSLVQMPVRNVLRAPRRTALTALGIAAVIATLVAVLGMIDSFIDTIDRAEVEVTSRNPERVSVGLATYTTADDPRVAALADVEGVAETRPTLDLGGTLRGNGEEFDVYVGLLDFASPIWAPSAVAGELVTDEPGLVLSQKAAADLGVAPGDRVSFEHPRREGGGYRMVQGEILVTALHPNPLRAIAYMDMRHADYFGLDGIVNGVQVLPEPGYPQEQLVRNLFVQSGVGSVQSVRMIIDTLRDTVAEVLDIFDVVQLAVLLLALLIAFNSSAIGADERAREHATMFAFGITPRTVLGIAVAESALMGVLATVLGVVAGRLLLSWMVEVLLPTTLPDLQVDVSVQVGTYLTAALFGIVAVAVAPVFTLRRLRRMDIPSTLRVVE